MRVPLAKPRPCPARRKTANMLDEMMLAGRLLIDAVCIGAKPCRFTPSDFQSLERQSCGTICR